MKRRIMQPSLFVALLSCLVCTGLNQVRGDQADPPAAQRPLNVLLLTLDDMGWATSGVEGCRVPGVTPHIDKLASEGILFTHGYVMVPMCGPSRAALLTGRYPHCNGMMGHGKQPPESWVGPAKKTPALSTYLHGRGYRTGAILKYKRTAFLNTWDVTYDEMPYGVGFHDRNAKSFYDRTLAFIAEAKQMDRPFFLYANPIDPHDPWADTQQEKELLDEYNPDNPFPRPGRRYSPEEVEVPACLPGSPGMKKNMAPYYEALHRGDECVGGILRALEDSGQAEHTIVVFLSDNGMGVPGAKNTLYQHGTRTPIIMKWPGKIRPGKVDDRSIVSAIDIMPTVVEACGLPPVEGIEGRSVFEVITGSKEVAEREYALTTFDYWGDSTPKQFYPQRSIINKEFCYIWNGYVRISNGEKVVPMPWNDVVQAGNENDSKLAARLAYYMDRPVEEFYDLSKDPGCWNNLINDPDYKERVAHFRKALKQEMVRTNDPQKENFDVAR